MSETETKEKRIQRLKNLDFYAQGLNYGKKKRKLIIAD